jgi:hypothetical protein
LSNLERWSELGNDTFDYERFFRNTVRLLEDCNDPWVIETLEYITRCVLHYHDAYSNYVILREAPSLNRRRPHVKVRDIESESDDSDDDATLILRQRAASRLLAAGQAAGVPDEVSGIHLLIRFYQSTIE